MEYSFSETPPHRRLSFIQTIRSHLSLVSLAHPLSHTSPFHVRSPKFRNIYETQPNVLYHIASIASDSRWPPSPTPVQIYKNLPLHVQQFGSHPRRRFQAPPPRSPHGPSSSAHHARGHNLLHFLMRFTCSHRRFCRFALAHCQQSSCAHTFPSDQTHSKGPCLHRSLPAAASQATIRYRCILRLGCHG